MKLMNVTLRCSCSLMLSLISFGVPCAVCQQVQPSDGRTVLSVTTQLVTLDVTVNDKSGHPVLDLEKSDFKITENGTAQSIRYFEQPSAHRMPSSKEIVRSAADLGKIGDAPVSLLVLDEINTRFVDMALARSALNRYLKAQPDVLSEPTALFFVDNQKLDVIQDYTQDKSTILLALKKHFPDYPWQLTVNSGDRAMLPRMSSSLTALLQIAEATRGIRGRKNVTWVGEGFPSVDVTQSEPDSVRVITEAIRKTTYALLQSKVSLFTIDPVTLETTQVIDEESDSGAAGADLSGTGLVFGGAIQFSSLAASTGGHAFAMNNFIDQEIASSISDGANYYELSYSPTKRTEDPAKYRKIAVKVMRPGLNVIARDGYFPADEPTAEAKAEEPTHVVSDVRFDLETAGLSKVSYDGLSVTAAKQSDGVYEVSIGASGLQWRDDPKGHIAELSMLAVCFSAKGKPLFKTSSEHTADTTAEVQHLTGALTYKLPLAAPRGTTRIRFVVRDLSSGKIGTTDVSLP